MVLLCVDLVSPLRILSGVVSLFGAHATLYMILRLTRLFIFLSLLRNS